MPKILNSSIQIASARNELFSRRSLQLAMDGDRISRENAETNAVYDQRKLLQWIALAFVASIDLAGIAKVRHRFCGRPGAVLAVMGSMIAATF